VSRFLPNAAYNIVVTRLGRLPYGKSRARRLTRELQTPASPRERRLLLLLSSSSRRIRRDPRANTTERFARETYKRYARVTTYRRRNINDGTITLNIYVVRAVMCYARNSFCSCRVIYDDDERFFSRIAEKISRKISRIDCFPSTDQT